MTLRHLPTIALVLVLAACSNTTGVANLSSLRASITHPDILTVQEDATGTYTIAGKNGMRFWAQDVAYGEASKGLEDWSIPLEVSPALSSEDPCAALSSASSETYLPVQTSLSHHCEVTTTLEGEKAILVIGFGTPFEGTDYLASMILVPRETDAAVLWGIARFPAFRDAAEEELQAFVLENPEATLWPAEEPEVLALYERVETLVREAIDEPSPDVAVAMETLRSIASATTLME